ncbi:thiamine kinase, partial [Salmonella enterica subsp. enterica serovar Heidelberg str. N4496]
MPTILTVSCCAVITTPTLHQPIFTSLPRLIPIASQSCAASAFYTPGWMAVEYLHGVVNSALPDADELAALLYHLHQQPRFGWRI